MRSTATGEVLLDTNVLVYAHNEDAPQHAPAVSLRDAAAAGEIRACIAHQNLLEFYSVVTSRARVARPLSAARAREQVRLYLSSAGFRILVPTEETPSRLLRIMRSVSSRGAGIFDLYLAATMLTHGVAAIATFNPEDFSSIPGVDTFVPGDT